MSVLSLVFPKRCIFCGKSLEFGDICGDCKAVLPWWGDCTDIGEDLPMTAPLKYEGKARLALLNFKFRGRKNYAKTFANLMEICVRNHFSADSIDVVTFIPLHWLRKLKRGYNQTELLANALSRQLGVKVQNTLTKPRYTKANSGLNSAQRAENVISAFALKRGAEVRGKRILLIDDVCTTGATLREATRILIQAGAEKIMCATVCRTT